jgi:hypothetical protein
LADGREMARLGRPDGREMARLGRPDGREMARLDWLMVERWLDWVG